MLLADSNIWLALALSTHEFHNMARDWFAKVKPAKPVLFCRVTQQSILRLLTTREVLAPYGLPALTNVAAWTTYEGFLADKRIAWANEPRGLESAWKKLAGHPLAAPKLWTDAYLAAFAISGGYQLVTTDKSFKQFAGLNMVLLSSKN
jgi:toxin-antitoxin system PIN domain toxin